MIELTLNISNKSSFFISSLTKSCFSFTMFLTRVSRLPKSLEDTCLKIECYIFIQALLANCPSPNPWPSDHLVWATCPWATLENNPICQVLLGKFSQHDDLTVYSVLWHMWWSPHSTTNRHYTAFDSSTFQLYFVRIFFKFVMKHEDMAMYILNTLSWVPNDMDLCFPTGGQTT
jgi:hypothetical protein